MTAEALLLVAALKLMAVGMTVVFLMLGSMVLAIKWLSRVVATEEGEIICQVAPPCGSSVVTPATVAAIGAAIHRYQRDHSVATLSQADKEERR
ncbi:MAG: OadG family protein [Aeromonadaceae bacterium]